MSKKHEWKEELTCKPLDTYDEIMLFLENPPPWRSLCKVLTPHSKFKVKNSEFIRYSDTFLESPETFCHFDPDAEEAYRHDENTLPKTLVCHDMANGYHDDSYIDGTADHEAYTFYNWAGIDIFCYFSHHLLTIPPLGWINVGHAHGVKVIGTLITEWTEGVDFWDKVLESEEEYKNFANTLVAITKTLKFDGWLLNVENKMSKPADLLKFVKYLNRLLHHDIPHAVLIWYDSVTIQGSLNWQNGLNEKNKAFFDACDGIFTNYSWAESDVEESAALAGDRLTDLYIGIDVWGRNFFGGGHFNTQEAVKVAYEHGCSLAIFAPAWTHEAMSTEKGDSNAVAMAEGLDKCQQFLLRDRALWGSLWPFLNTTLPCSLPFKTSFCRGQGKKRYMYGEVLCNTPWYNLRHQQYQPNSAHGPHRYLLSTLDAILHHSRETYKDGKGILRYPDSFHMSRLELHSTQKFKASDSYMDASKQHMPRESIIVPRNDSLNSIRAEATDAAEETPETSELNKPKGRRSYFKGLLRFKSPGKESAAGAEVERGAAQSDARVGGKSMVQMSVNLKLGSKGSRQRYALACVPEELECLELHAEDAFSGGACLRVNPSDSLSPEHRLTRLFHCDFPCEGALIVCVVTKKLPGYADQFLNVKLYMRGAREEERRVVLIGRPLPVAPGGGAGGAGGAGGLALVPLDPAGERFRDLQRFMLLNESSFYVPIENSYDWKVRYYEVHQPGYRITSINCRTGIEHGPILLGQLSLCSMPTDWHACPNPAQCGAGPQGSKVCRGRIDRQSSLPSASKSKK